MTTPATSSGRRLGRTTSRRAAEAVVRAIIYLCGWMAIIILGAIAIFLMWNSLRAVSEAGLFTMLSTTAGYPTSSPGKFGMLPLIMGSLFVTGVALAVSVPVGVAAAVYISEFSGRLVKEVMKEEGNRMQFWRVAMKPGRPLAFGAMGEVPIVGLPGNPITPVADFRGGSPGVGGHQGHPGFQGAPDNGLIPQEEPPLPRLSGQKL